MAKRKPKLIEEGLTPVFIPPPEDGPNPGEAFEVRRILQEITRRQIEALKLYRPMPHQAPFHTSRVKEKIILGSNRSGKTLSAAVEVSQAVTGQDPYGKYPRENGIWYCVGKDGRETGQVMWRKLGRAGAFKIIRDKETGAWRSFNPMSQEDLDRQHLAKPAPPLIPPRLIKEISWENKKENLPKIVRLFNGWELHFFSSLGKPPHGADIDGAWFDEEIIDPDWYPEIAARLIDRHGTFLWSATPQAGTERLYELHERAEAQAELPPNERTIEEYRILLADNIHLSQRQKREFEEKLDDDERLVRIHGEFALKGTIVFPEYLPSVHDASYRLIPRHWTRYLSVDPGHQVCAVLFLAVPPPQEGREVWVYDELYIRNCNAVVFGLRMRDKCQGQSFRTFIIDNQEGRKRDTGGGREIKEQYSEQLRAHRIKSEMTDSGFFSGDTNVKAGIESIRRWLRQDDFGFAKLRIMADRCPNLKKEMKGYRYKREKDREGKYVITDEPTRKNCHLIDNLRYLAQYDPQWFPPGASPTAESAAYRAFAQWVKPNNQNYGITLGPGR